MWRAIGRTLRRRPFCVCIENIEKLRQSMVSSSNSIYCVTWLVFAALGRACPPPVKLASSSHPNFNKASYHMFILSVTAIGHERHIYGRCFQGRKSSRQGFLSVGSFFRVQVGLPPRFFAHPQITIIIVGGLCAHQPLNAIYQEFH